MENAQTLLETTDPPPAASGALASALGDGPQTVRPPVGAVEWAVWCRSWWNVLGHSVGSRF